MIKRLDKAAGRFWIDIAAIAVLMIALPALASDEAPARTSFSSGGFVSGAPSSGVKPDIDAPASKTRTLPAESLGTGFRIFDALATVYYDDDRDGHFYGLDVSFDADTDFFSADVYARLYLSYEGGPWELYYTTDWFTILGASGLDDYRVSTELFENYPTGYYDVLIEIYDVYDDFVAEFGPDESSALFSLPLEDQQKDAPVVIVVPGPGVSVSQGGGGALGLGGLLVLGVLAFARRLH